MQDCGVPPQVLLLPFCLLLILNLQLLVVASNPLLSPKRSLVDGILNLAANL